MTQTCHPNTLSVNPLAFLFSMDTFRYKCASYFTVQLYMPAANLSLPKIKSGSPAGFELCSIIRIGYISGGWLAGYRPNAFHYCLVCHYIAIHCYPGIDSIVCQPSKKNIPPQSCSLNFLSSVLFNPQNTLLTTKTHQRILFINIFIITFILMLHITTHAVKLFNIGANYSVCNRKCTCLKNVLKMFWKLKRKINIAA